MSRSRRSASLGSSLARNAFDGRPPQLSEYIALGDWRLFFQARDDLEKVTATAKQMVMRFGMSEKLGPRVFGHDHGQPFLGREFSSEPDYSDEIASEIDAELPGDTRFPDWRDGTFVEESRDTRHSDGPPACRSYIQ